MSMSIIAFSKGDGSRRGRHINSIYTDEEEEKEKKFKLFADSASMGFAVFLDPNYLKTDKMKDGIKLSYK